MTNRQRDRVPALLIALFCGLIAALFLFLCLVPRGGSQKAEATLSPARRKPPLVILDAGHGGFDGGAVGPDGKPESELNLAFCKTLAPMLRAFGFEVLLTRSDEGSLEEDPTRPIRERKRSDMHTRLAIMEEHPGAVFLSIHQNKSPYRSARGSVVYYGPSHPGSRVLARHMQKNLVEQLQKDNRRTEICADDRLFLLRKAPCPAVLVECGFLSNAEEYALLCSETYQKSLCLVLAQTLAETYFDVQGAATAAPPPAPAG